MTAPDSFGSLLAVGIVGMFAVQVIINIGVVIGMFPVTGITLPLISARRFVADAHVDGCRHLA